MSLNFQRISTIFISKSNSGYVFFKIEETLEIVLSRSNRDTFLGTPGAQPDRKIQPTPKPLRTAAMHTMEQIESCISLQIV